MSPTTLAPRHFDVLILGAGLSGIGAACHLTRKLPGKTYAILERRDAIGGTWDLFRYPGIRSDSDMSTFGFSFRPWREPKVLADGPSIKGYLHDTAREYGVLPHIRFGRKVVGLEWSTPDARWTVKARNEATGAEESWTAQFVIAATGYYNYDAGFTPEFAGRARFKGAIVHPQHWPEGLDCAGKKVVVIGSGATAVTLVPSLAEGGAHVTMLQRSPTYILPVPAVDPLWATLSRILPGSVVYALTRVRNVLLQRALYVASRRRPKAVQRLLRAVARRQLGDKVDLRHFTPRYAPWDERMCVVPNGDLFRELRRGRAQICTDTIKTFDEAGLQLDSGERLDADIVVTATGLNLQLLGGAQVRVDGRELDIKQHMAYKGMLISGVPNLLPIFGYTNASWTLKSDLVSEFFCRLVAHLDKRGLKVVRAEARDVRITEETVMGSLSSGYVRRGADQLPRQGEKAPWRVMNDYLRDAVVLKLGRVTDPALQFS